MYLNRRAEDNVSFHFRRLVGNCHTCDHQTYVLIQCRFITVAQSCDLIAINQHGIVCPITTILIAIIIKIEGNNPVFIFIYFFCIAISDANRGSLGSCGFESQGSWVDYSSLWLHRPGHRMANTHVRSVCISWMGRY